MPKLLNNTKEAYQQVRENGGYLFIHNLSLIQVTGKDAASYINTQTTNDVLAINDGYGQANNIVDRKAHFRAHFTIHKLNNLFFIISENNQIELGFSGDELVACVHVKKESPQTLYFGMLTVKPGMQAIGFGKFILNQVETIAKQWGCSQVRISVLHLRTELISYYERRGYVKTGRSEPFHVDESVFGKPKVEGLKLLEMIKRLS